jgi:hypothetical protein
LQRFVDIKGFDALAEAAARWESGASRPAKGGADRLTSSDMQSDISARADAEAAAASGPLTFADAEDRRVLFASSGLY